MKHITEICKQCGSKTRGQIYEKELLDDSDLDRIRICNACKSEYFLYDELALLELPFHRDLAKLREFRVV